MTVGERIRQRRLEKGMSENLLAALVGVEKISLIRWEEGVNTPHPKNLFKLAKVLDTPFSWLVGDDADQP